MAWCKRRVAILEDDTASREVLKLILEDQYEVTCYEDGISGLEGIRHEIPQAVVMDINMPYMDGIQVIQEIRNDPDLAGIFAVALTAHGMTGDREKFLGLGFNYYVLKPVLDFEALMRTLDSHLLKRSA